MQVGDRVKVRPETFGPDMAISTAGKVINTRPLYPGRVTFISRKGWYQVTFDNGVKECFFLDVEPTPLIKDRGGHRGEWR